MDIRSRQQDSQATRRQLNVAEFVSTAFAILVVYALTIEFIVLTSITVGDYSVLLPFAAAILLGASIFAAHYCANKRRQSAAERVAPGLKTGFTRLTLVLSICAAIITLLASERPGRYVGEYKREQLRALFEQHGLSGQKLTEAVSHAMKHPKGYVEYEEIDYLVRAVSEAGYTGDDLARRVRKGAGYIAELRWSEEFAEKSLPRQLLWATQNGFYGIGGYALAFLTGFAGVWAMYLFVRYPICLSLRYIARGFAKGGRASSTTSD